MKRIKINPLLILAVVFAIGMTSCGDKNAEKRIEELERRLSEVENGDNTTPSTTTPAAVTTEAATPTEKPDGPLPSFNFDEMEWDFGNINNGDIVEHTFSFTNNGQAPLIIESAKATCGCTVPQWPKDPIPVGGTGEILVRFDSKNKPGVQNKNVTITANTWPATTTLRIKTFVNNETASDGSDGPVK